MVTRLLGRRLRRDKMQHYPSAGAGRRSRESEPRQHKVTVRLSDAELAAVIAAADQAGLAPAAYIARAGVDAAEHRVAPIAGVQREALIELIRAAELAYRMSMNLEQAVAKPNATGAPGPDPGPAVADCMQVVHRIDEAAQAIQRSLKLRSDERKPVSPAGFRRKTPLARPRPPSLQRTPSSQPTRSPACPMEPSGDRWVGALSV
jgi:Mobilization protein NikA